MTDKMKDAIEKVFNDLMSLSKEEFHKKLEEHKNGDIALMLLESGALDVTEFGQENESDKLGRTSQVTDDVPIGGNHG